MTETAKAITPEPIACPDENAAIPAERTAIFEERKDQIHRIGEGAFSMACNRDSLAGAVSQRACVFCGSRVVLYPIADADRDLTVLDDIDRQAGVSGLEDGGAGEELDGAHQAALGLGGWAMHKRSALRIDEPAPLGTGRGKAEHAGQEGVP